MKVHLMFRDQDFLVTKQFPPNADDLTKDLEINILLKAMTVGDSFLLDIARETLLNSLKKVDSILYRQEILKDCLENASVVRALYQITVLSMNEKRRNWLGVFTHSPNGVLGSAVKLMKMYVERLKELRQISDDHSLAFHSEGFSQFFTMIQKELTDEYLAEVENHLNNLSFQEGVLISSELGKGNEGTNLTLRLANKKSGHWLKDVIKKNKFYSFKLSERDDAGLRALSDIRDMGINAAADSLAQATDHIDNFFMLLRNELAFYVGCINLKEQIEKNGNPITFPIPVGMDERKLTFRDMYDVSLALITKQKIVGNNIDANEKNLFIITGANQGGKSTFIRSIGLAQLMMQAGMFVSATQFSSNLCQGIFTHFKRKEDASMKSGKFNEELNRMSFIVDHLQANSLMLFNESFAATNEREGSEIARQVTSALLDRNIIVFFVTHMYELALIFYEKQMKDAIFLRAGRKAGGKRTFRLTSGEPLPTSYGQDIYKTIFEKE